ncbi:Lsr2 family DNA-binding protein [Embleya hyalina]|uniref:Lsr2 DNA-binding domain-containing protein n=1 Tax=Embleya hyalina TaxID=516124 RepID=A0A401Z3Z6_9ACTN|nr:histone-like nucleoid-structuring protein Lsr2 [Embleya hyalina]GCE01571.1 hypothetical protein EHYA_09337 [Embleya hyalina]
MTNHTTATAAEVIDLATRAVRESNAQPDPRPLLTWARGHESASVRALADRADAAIEAVAERRRREKDIVAAEQRVKEAEKELAAARRKLQANKSGKAAAQARLTEAAREEGRRARAWAVAHDIPVPDRGRVSTEIITKYRAATGGTP